MDDHINECKGPIGRVYSCDLCPKNSPFVVLVKNAVWKHGPYYAWGQISKAKAKVREHIRNEH